MTSIITVSSKGQIVVPKNIRDELGIGSGMTFAIFGKDDTIVLKKVDIPSAKEMFDKVSSWANMHAKNKKWKEDDVMKKIHKGRGITIV